MGRIRTGVDMVYIPRIQRLAENSPDALRRIFTPQEMSYCTRSDGTLRFDRLAARFAAREAVLKAIGTGFATGLGVGDVSVDKGERGEPIAVLSDTAREIFRAMGGIGISISLTHENEYACAFAVAEFDDTPDGDYNHAHG